MTKKIRVAVVSNSFPNSEQKHRGVYIKQTVDHLAAYVAIHIICPLPWFPDWKFLSRYKKWAIFGRIPRNYKFENWDVISPKYLSLPKISAHLSTLLMFPSLFLALYRLHKKSGIDVIHVHNVFPEGVTVVFIGKLLRIPVVVSARGTDVNEAFSSGKIRSLQISWALNKACKVTAVSLPLGNKILELAPAVKSVSYIPNGVDKKVFCCKDRVAIREKHGVPPDKKIALFIGKFRKVKGIEYLIEALSILNTENSLNFDMVFVGSGPLQESYETSIAANNLQRNVRFLGNLSHDQISDWLAMSNALCLPSLNEGMPNVVLEALSCGVPVVATQVGGIPDVVTSENGILVPSQNSKQLAEALKSVVSKSWNAVHIEKSVAEFTWEITAEKYIRVYRDAIPGLSADENV